MDRLWLLGQTFIRLNTHICLDFPTSTKCTHTMEKYKTTFWVLTFSVWSPAAEKEHSLENPPPVWVPSVLAGDSAETTFNFSRKNWCDRMQSTGETNLQISIWILKPTGWEWAAILTFRNYHNISSRIVRQSRAATKSASYYISSPPSLALLSPYIKEIPWKLNGILYIKNGNQIL